MAPSSLTLHDLAEFTGNDPIRYGPYWHEAHEQAVDLFLIACSISELPSGPFEGLAGRSVRRGILAMIEALCEAQNARDLRFAPFKTETIGSYNYTLSEKIQQGVPTGVAWFDIAVDQAVGGSSVSASSISVFDRVGDVREIEGRPELLGPADVDRWPPRALPMGYPGRGMPG